MGGQSCQHKQGHTDQWCTVSRLRGSQGTSACSLYVEALMAGSHLD